MDGRLDRTTTNCCKGIAAIIIMLHHISFRVSNLPVYVKPIWYIAFPIVGFFFFMSGFAPIFLSKYVVRKNHMLSTLILGR